MRIEILFKSHFNDGRAERLLKSIESLLHIRVRALLIIDCFRLQGIEISEIAARRIFLDPVAQTCVINKPALEQFPSTWNFILEVAYKPGVTDTVASTAKEALKNNGIKLEGKSLIQNSIQYVFTLADKPVKQTIEDLKNFLHNPLIQNTSCILRDEWLEGKRLPQWYPSHVTESTAEIEHIDILAMDDNKLEQLSRQRLLALTLAEMKTIQKEFARGEFISLRRSHGLSEKITDTELEMLAQSWSEHCKHKIFAATIKYTAEGKSATIRSLFNTYIKDTTERLAPQKGFLRSVFHDNSGVIEFNSATLVCFKTETHNSPSALDPYGGAITGIVGVNRDIMGTGKGAKPIFNTNVLCFADPKTERQKVPQGLLHPRRVMDGVHKGIVDGGNQSGIPVAAGAFLFDDSYIGKPLVFCGTGGILPAKLHGEGSWLKHIDAGDHAVMLGGRIGKDGIHGATFSSLALDEDSPTSAVQIGDPITQKKMLDFLIEARDLGLYKGLTDNGAGGLSSSLGEMADYSGGILIELDKCPLKYQGLAPWEILVSESQERMSLAVAEDTLAEFLALAARRDVEATVVGTFTATGYIEIKYQQDFVGLLDLNFLHGGLPAMELSAVWQHPQLKIMPETREKDLKATILAVLSDPNIASKESLVRQYDHEVQAQSVIKPFTGIKENGPTDGGVLRPDYRDIRGITVTHGICPRIGDYDTKAMAMCAVDEAFRAHVALGGDPQYAAALDNFCWPDPLPSPTNPDASYKLAQLVRACEGLQEICLAYGLPLISGKDSMKNDAFAEGKKISVRPTLLVSLLGIIPDTGRAVTTDFKAADNLIFLLNLTGTDYGGSAYERYCGVYLGGCPQVIPATAFSIYQALHSAMLEGLILSCHDISEGGLMTALTESCIGGQLGMSINLAQVPAMHGRLSDTAALFAETPSRFLVEVAPVHKMRFATIFKDLPTGLLGTTRAEPVINIFREKKQVLSLNLAEAESAWETPI